MQKKDVFGSRGDFTTSPEISQIFGEVGCCFLTPPSLPPSPPSQLVGVWVLADWMVAGEPRSWSLVELGPGRGTLLRDVLRVFGQFRHMLDSLSVHLVEASPAMSRVQEATLTGHTKSAPPPPITGYAPSISASLQERRERSCLVARRRCFMMLPTRPVL